MRWKWLAIYFSVDLNVVFYVVDKMICSGKLYGFLSTTRSIIYMLKWLRILFNPITWFIHTNTRAHAHARIHTHTITTFLQQQSCFAHSIFIRSSMICVNEWFWMGAIVNARTWLHEASFSKSNPAEISTL